MSKTEFFYHTHDPRYGQKSAASSKNGKFFVTDFSVFYFAVKPSENDEKCRKPNSFITPIDPRYGQKSAASSKNGKFVRHRYFMCFILLYNHLKIMKNFENRILLLHPLTRDMDKKVLPAVKMGIFCHRFFVLSFCRKTI